MNRDPIAAWTEDDLPPEYTGGQRAAIDWLNGTRARAIAVRPVIDAAVEMAQEIHRFEKGMGDFAALFSAEHKFHNLIHNRSTS